MGQTMKPWCRPALLTLLCVALPLLSACRKGPDRAGLTSDLQAKLDRNFGGGVFEVETVGRRGSYPYEEEGDSRERLLVYYNAELRFAKAYKLSQWDQPNVGSLISVLGANPQGVTGVKSTGNAANDKLSVYGAFAYVREGEGWRPAVHVQAKQKRRGQPSSEELPPYRKRMESISKVGKLFQIGNRQNELTLLEQDLATVLHTAERRLARSKGWITLATASASGEYNALGRNLENLLTRRRDEGGKKIGAKAVTTRGSVENCRLVHGREVNFAFSQNDVAHMAYHGTDLFESDVPMKNLRALCSLYPEAVQFVTLRSSGLRGMDDLRGKKIDIGPEGSGIRINAIQVLRAAGIELSELAEVRGRTREEAITELRDGQVDAIVMTATYPAIDLLKLTASHPIRLIPLEEPVAEELAKAHPFFIPVTLARNTYPEMDEQVNTVAVTALVITQSSTPNAKVKVMLETIFSDAEALTEGILSAYYISLEKARTGLSIPLHPAAEEFLDSQR